jgi:hypothetical protein
VGKVVKNVLQKCDFEKNAKVNRHLNGENSPNLVTLKVEVSKVRLRTDDRMKGFPVPPNTYLFPHKVFFSRVSNRVDKTLLSNDA